MRIQEHNTKDDLARYQDKDGHVFSVTAADAERMGYTAVDAAPAEESPAEQAPEEKAVDSAPANKARKSAPANKSE